MGAHGTAESGEILGILMKRVLVISDKQVHHLVYCISGKSFCEVLDEWRSRGVTDCDGIERLEVVDKAQGFTILFEDAKPVGAVCGCGWFVDSGCDLVLDNSNCFCPHSRRNRGVSQHSWSVRYSRDLDGREVSWIHSTMLEQCPSQSHLLLTHDPAHKLEFI